MTFPVLDIPDEQTELIPWLERQLMGMELGDLVATLAAVHSEREGVSLNAICGDELDVVYAEGLTSLSESQLRQLLTNPHLLLDLQERIHLNGGDYWQRVPVAEEAEKIIQRQRSAIDAHFTAGVSEPLPTRSGGSQAKPGRRTWLLGLVAAAAVVVVAVLLNREGEPVGWGWDRPDALAVDLPPDEYLEHLAAAANDWFNQRPDTDEALAQRLREFRTGCDTLISAPHPQLPADDRQWLVDKCVAWAEKIDGHLADLQQGEDALTVRDEADETVRALIDALEEQAGLIG